MKKDKNSTYETNKNGWKFPINRNKINKKNFRQ